MPLHLLLAVTLACQAQETPAVPAPAAPAEVPAQAPTEAPTRAERALAAGETLLGEPYRWGGRNEPGHPGVDCLGLLYLAWGSVTGTPWRRYPVNPSEIVASGLLGAPVPGLDGVLRAEVDMATLRPGDVLYFLMANYEIPDTPLWGHEGTPHWPWHTGLYVGEGRVLHAAPGARVRHQDLSGIAFDALYVTRP